MAISARNTLNAIVKSIKKGMTNDVIELCLESGESLVSVITTESTEKLGLNIGSSAVAIFKAPSVILSTDNDLILSSRNQFSCEVISIKNGVVNAEVTVKTQGGIELVAVITEASLVNLGLNLGTKVTALIKSSSVILGVKA